MHRARAAVLDEHAHEPIPTRALEALGGQPLEQHCIGLQPGHRHSRPPARSRIQPPRVETRRQPN